MRLPDDFWDRQVNEDHPTPLGVILGAAILIGSVKGLLVVAGVLAAVFGIELQ